MTPVDFGIDHQVDHAVVPMRVDPPTDDAPELELVSPPAPTWRDRPRALPRRDPTERK